jgi:DNA-binding NtrC family response regulator
MVESKQKTSSSGTGIFARLGRLGLRGQLLLALLPSILAILLFSGYASYKVSNDYIDIALMRNVKVHTLAIVHEIERFMDDCRTNLLVFSFEEMRAEALKKKLENRIRAGGIPFFEVGYIPASGGEPVILVQRDGVVRRIDPADYTRMQPNPLLELERLGSLKPGEVVPSHIMGVVYPMPSDEASNLFVKTHIIRFSTYYEGVGDTPPGIFFMSVEATLIRDILSVYNSPNSPLWAFPRSQELRFSYLLDTEGWILFQSEPLDSARKELTTYLARENFDGTLGREGHATAFRPNENTVRYWNAVKDIREGKNGMQVIDETHIGQSKVKSFYYSYAPISFRRLPQGPPSIYGGAVFIDRSQLPIIAGYKHLDVMLFVTTLSVGVIALLIFFFGRILTTPIRKLATRMNELSTLDTMEEIDLPYSGFDMEMLQRSINNIIRRVKQQVVEIQARDKTILDVNNRERASLEKELAALGDVELTLIPEIIGQGPAISSLKADIIKAAQVDVDVLIFGETGTGKQLVAEAVHNHGNRKGKPFVSINCGALDENLLLDALFGHVKGAFSEAKTDRNGAIYEANGGTLFLDEIQSASAKVQQSLLRALSSRKVKPLGSDKELDFDVRIIAATNVDIPKLIEQRLFREDLYYRLKVVSINTPSLRNHPENIPLLSVYYLKQAEQLTGRTNLGLSKGALARLMTYHWPGNVRELVNSITRAAVMAETETIQREEIKLEDDSRADLETPPVIISAPAMQAEETPPAPQDEANDSAAHPADRESAQPQRPGQEPAHQKPTGQETPRPTARAKGAQAEDTPLSDRQSAAWAHIRQLKTVTRKQYQDIVGDRLPTRTAIYDLQDLVRRGLLVKKGQGPSTRYEVVAGK